ncbi:MAG TPA: hypothetical protein VMN35_05450 [Gaiellaceae bacterium]|nr:hypothetical protein [Gaiellaceae bacterium]
MNGEGLRSKHVDAFIGISSTESTDSEERDEHPTFELALERAAILASRAGYAGTHFQVSLEIVPEAHNQWIKTYRVIITPEG